MTENLLPCPFCGGCPVLTEAMTEHWVSCGTCGASGGMHGRLKLAVEAWNRRTPAPEGEAWTARHIVFDGPPDHNGPRFIEVETPEGKSVNAGEWRQRPDNLWELVIASPVVPVGVSREALLKAVRPVLDRHPMIDSSQSHKLDIQAGWVADAILAALRPTDTGANHD